MDTHKNILKIAILAAAMLCTLAIKSQSVALKSNLLYDAILIPNLGGEVYLGDQWSVTGDWSYAWWGNWSKRRFKRTYSGYVSARKWLGEERFKGHHLGLYCQWLRYDFERHNVGYKSAGFNYAAGIEYGYSFRLTDNLNLDCSISVGYLFGRYKKYYPKGGNSKADRPTDKILPTKAEVGLVWLINAPKHKNR